MTLGCKVNAYESECYSDALKLLGFTEVSHQEKADVYIINTCAVTNTAAQKSRQKIHLAKKLNPDALICVVGCLVQIDKNVEKEDVDILIGSSHKSELAVRIAEAYETREKIKLVDDLSKPIPFENLNMKEFAHQTRAYLKIEDGCNQFCSFCTIPLARGRERSLNLQDVQINAQRLLDAGHKEIVLTGIHSGRYNDGEHTLIDVLEMLVKIRTPRIRISSIEVTEVTDEIIAFMKAHGEMARHLHIPLQAGSNSVLKNMHRPYTKEEFIERVLYMQKEIDGLAIGSDIIVGFPQESDSDYAQTKEAVKQANITYLHVFPYSVRNGTVAAKMSGQIPQAVKKQRVSDLISYGNQRRNAFYESFIGKETEVLLERRVGEYWQGHSSEYLPVAVKSERDLHSMMVHVMIREIVDDVLIGELKDEIK